MAISMTVNFYNLQVECYIKVVNVFIDNKEKTCRGDLVFLQDSNDENTLPVKDLKTSFFGIKMLDGQDPRDLIYQEVMSHPDYSLSVKC